MGVAPAERRARFCQRCFAETEDVRFIKRKSGLKPTENGTRKMRTGAFRRARRGIYAHHLLLSESVLAAKGVL